MQSECCLYTQLRAFLIFLQESNRNFALANFQYLEISGRSFYTLLISTMTPTPGKVCYKVQYWLRSVNLSVFLFIWTIIRRYSSGIQAYFHIPKLSRQRGKGNKVRERSYPWNDQRNTRIYRVRCDSGRIPTALIPATF